jgi:hypothetical protein
MTTVSSTYNHEEAVLEAIQIAHKNHRLNNSMSNSSRRSSVTSTRSCLKDASVGSTATNSSRRSVSFCDKGHQCEEFEMYAEEEHQVVWFSAEEYDEMKRGFEFTIFMMDAGCPEKVEDDEHTTRGLEKRSEEGQWKRYERKRDYYNAVLDEQERQWEENIDDQNLISQVAVEVNRDSLREAYDQGVLDEIEVYGHALRRSTSERTASTDNSEPSVSDQE